MDLELENPGGLLLFLTVLLFFLWPSPASAGAPVVFPGGFWRTANLTENLREKDEERELVCGQLPVLFGGFSC